MIWLHGALHRFGFSVVTWGLPCKEMASGVTARLSLLVFILMLTVFPWLLRSGGGSILPSTLSSILGRGALQQCFLKYIYSLCTIDIITLAMTNATVEYAWCLNRLCFFSVLLFEFLCLENVIQSHILTRYHGCVFALHKFCKINEWNLYSVWRGEKDGLLHMRAFTIRWGDTIWWWGIPWCAITVLLITLSK